MRRLRKLSTRLCQDQAGSILPLIIGFAVVALGLILVANAVSSLYLERARLYTLADGAALAAAGTVSPAELAAGPGGAPAPRLDPDRVRRAAGDYLAAASEGRRIPVRLSAAATDDGRSATVRLREDWRPPLLSWAVPRGVRLQVTARARSLLW